MTRPGSERWKRTRTPRAIRAARTRVSFGLLVSATSSVPGGDWSFGNGCSLGGGGGLPGTVPSAFTYTVPLMPLWTWQMKPYSPAAGNVNVTGAAAARTGTGAFTVSGTGNHTVEFRSTDWAGNVESTKVETFRIGTPPQGSPPSSKPPTFTLAKVAGMTAGAFARHGLRVKVSCTDAMRGAAALIVSKSTKRKLHLKSSTLARTTIRCADAGAKTVTLKPSRKTARVLGRAHRSIKAALRVSLKAVGHSARTRTRSVTLRR